MKTLTIIISSLIIIFGATSAFGNTIFSEDEWQILSNWNTVKNQKNQTAPEGYSSPDTGEINRLNERNTIFSKQEWIILENWERDRNVNYKSRSYSNDKSRNTLFTKDEWRIINSF